MIRLNAVQYEKVRKDTPFCCLILLEYIVQHLSCTIQLYVVGQVLLNLVENVVHRSTLALARFF